MLATLESGTAIGSMFSATFEVALEICNLNDGEETTMSHSGDLWDNIIAMTRRKSKRKSIEPPPSDTPHLWNDFTKHAALANLLDAARAMDTFECQTMIPAARSAPGKSMTDVLADIEQGCSEFGRMTREKFADGATEWA